MKKQIFIILIFISGIGNIFSQQPPEYIDFIFKNSDGRVISPELIIIENSVQVDFRKDSLFIKSDTVKLNFDDELNSFGKRYKNENNIEISRISSITFDHYLGEEIIFIAKYDEKIMEITFFGQAMNNFGVWESGYNSKNPVIIDFREGAFLFYASGFLENQTLHEKRQLIKLKKNHHFFSSKNIRIESKRKLDLIKIKGLSYNKELLPLQNLLKNNKEKMYVGYIFKNNIPIGYGIVRNDESKILYFRKKIIKND